MRGIDEEKVGAWLADNIADVTPPFRFELIAGGRSNLTFRATDGAGRELVVRRPPLGHVLASAHDMARSTGSSRPSAPPTCRYLRPSACAPTSP